MRISLLILVVLAVGVCIEKPAEARSYPWCAYYNMGGFGGATNCGFATWQQCQAAISGVGGSCGANPMYQPSRGTYLSTRPPSRDRYRY
jgi:Protein of unknown function (DUF3551)